MGPESITVRLDENGPDPAEAVFEYSRYVPDAPAPKVALVYVKYVAPDEHVFYSTTVPCTAGLETAISLDTDQVDPAWQYELASEETVVVKVDQDGTPSPAEVVFRFKNEEPVVIPVRYVDAATGENVASPFPLTETPSISTSQPGRHTAPFTMMRGKSAGRRLDRISSTIAASAGSRR